MTFLYNFYLDLRSFIKRNIWSFVFVNLLLIFFAICGYTSACNSNVDICKDSNSLIILFLRDGKNGFVGFLCVFDVLLVITLVLSSFKCVLQRVSIVVIGMRVSYVISTCYYVFMFSGVFSIFFVLIFLLLQIINCFICQCLYVYIKCNELILSDIWGCRENYSNLIIIVLIQLVITLISCLILSFLQINT